MKKYCVDYSWYYVICPVGCGSSFWDCGNPKVVIAHLGENYIRLAIPSYLSDMEDLVRKYESEFDDEITIHYEDGAPKRNEKAA